MSLQEYKCPNCGGALEFDSDIQKLRCPFCKSEYSADEFEEKIEAPEQDDISWNINAGSQWENGEAESLRSYVCKSCGGEIIRRRDNGGCFLPVLRESRCDERAI